MWRLPDFLTRRGLWEDFSFKVERTLTCWCRSTNWQSTKSLYWHVGPQLLCSSCTFSHVSSSDWLFDFAAKTHCQPVLVAVKEVGSLRFKTDSSAPTPATVNIVMPWREAHYELAGRTELPDKVLSALADFIKDCWRWFKVRCLFGANTMPLCWLKALVELSFNRGGTEFLGLKL